ncbi:hypothetical protein AMTR_s00056p00222980 [Amborella trichopoda]|uniref:Retrotransposon Copia-like N-terminal domain-containing protein n=1 Tax=Amborella trichopoda TaxID=13333 RepID=U5CQ18_AMBTC|nr:hypothetical protein AMTR_s00056p00222980 [Amborella trichopoda]
MNLSSPEPNNESINEQKTKYAKWKRSNRMSLMIMKGSISKTIRGAIPDEDNAESFVSKLQEQFVFPTKSLANALMTKLLTTSL